MLRYFAAIACSLSISGAASAQSMTADVPQEPWERIETANPMADSPNVYFGLPSNETILINGVEQRAFLAVGNVDGKDRVYIAMGSSPISCIGSLTPIRARFDDRRPLTFQCEISVDYTKASIATYGTFISNLRRSKNLTVEFTPMETRTPAHATFDLTGFAWPRSGRFY